MQPKGNASNSVMGVAKATATSSTLRRSAKSTVEFLVMVGGPWKPREAGREGSLGKG